MESMTFRELTDQVPDLFGIVEVALEQERPAEAEIF